MLIHKRQADDTVKGFDQGRHLFLTVKSIDKDDPNIVYATVSTDEIDRYGEIVRPSAFKEALPAFIKNPVVLPAHQHKLPSGDPPVIGIILTDGIQIRDHTVDMPVKFDDDELGQKYARKYQKKMMRAFSIGFRGIEGGWDDVDGTRTWVWTKIELLEVSAVAVPANRGALARALGYYESEDKDGVPQSLSETLHRDIAELATKLTQLQNTVDVNLDEIKTLLIADPGGMAERLIGAASDPPVHGGDKHIDPDTLVKAITEVTKDFSGVSKS